MKSRVATYLALVGLLLLSYCGISEYGMADTGRHDRGNAAPKSSLYGTWALVGNPQNMRQPKPGARKLFIGDGHWTITQADPKSGLVTFHHGGTYDVEGNVYVEKITFATAKTKNLIGSTFKFKWIVNGDVLIKTGVGNPFNEKWQRIGGGAQ